MEEHRKRVLDVCQRLSDKLDAAAVQLECERPRTIINITSEDHTVLVWALHDYWDRVLNQKESTSITTVDTHRLTLEEIKRMSCPIWVKCKPLEGGAGYWCLNNHGYIVTPGGNCFNVEKISSWEFYRRPPSTEAITLADEIRAMSDEELVDFLWRFNCDSFENVLPFCKNTVECGEELDSGDISTEMCKRCLLDRLHQPYDGTL